MPSGATNDRWASAALGPGVPAGSLHWFRHARPQDTPLVGVPGAITKGAPMTFGEVSGNRARAKEPGFTLVELLTVLVFVGLLISIAAPVLNPGRWRADSAVQELMVGLNAAQRLAVLRQHDVVVTFLVDERRISVHRDADNDGTLDAGEDARVIELPETIGFSRGDAPPIGGAADDVTFAVVGGGHRLVFHQNGSASESGTAYLRPVEGSMSVDAESSRAISIERATGQVRCFSYRTRDWVTSC
jgi:prepilin-type N-terminal cleavage/methylation domain-containing protein